MASKTLPFRTAYSEHIRFIDPTGNGIEPTYEYEIDSKGLKKLVKTGTKNVYDEIQSYAEDCKIENILARVAVGDMSDFKPQGIYQDITKIPNNLIQAKKEMLKMEKLFAAMPPEVKNKYNNSVDVFMSHAGEKAWLVDTGLIQPINPIAKPDLKVDTTVETPKPTE